MNREYPVIEKQNDFETGSVDRIYKAENENDAQVWRSTKRQSNRGGEASQAIWALLDLIVTSVD
jgi:hypothetical protein